MKKLSIVVGLLLLAEFIILPIYCSKSIAAAESESAETQLRIKISELVKAELERDELKEQVNQLKKELAVIKLKAVKADIVKGKTKDKSSLLYFDVNILTPKEQVQKLDKYIEQLKA